MTPLIITESKPVCCCGAKTWTKAIAYIEIFCALLSVVVRALVFQILLYYNQDEVGSTFDSQGYLQKYEILIYVYLFSCPIFIIVEAVINIVLGITLFLGAHLGKPALLLVWLVACCLGLVPLLLLISYQIYALLMEATPTIVITLVVALVILVFQIFCFYVVYAHRRELVVLRNQLESIIHFNSFHVDVVKHNM